jgi:hypothetical protein
VFYRAVVAIAAVAFVGAPTLAQAPRAPAPPPREVGSGLTDAQKVQKADEHIVRMRQILKQVISRLEDARTEKDIVKLNCVNEKLTQIKGLLRVSEQADIALQESAARRDEGAESEYQKIAIAKVKVEQLRADAEECIGQLAFVVDEKTVVEVELPKDLPQQDLTERQPPPPPVTRPPPASKFQ